MRLGKGSLPRENKRVSKARAGVGNSTLWGSGSLAARRIGRKPEGEHLESRVETACRRTCAPRLEHVSIWIRKAQSNGGQRRPWKECCHCPWCVWTKARLELTEEWAWGREGIRDNRGGLELGNEWSRERGQQLKWVFRIKEIFILKRKDVRDSLYAIESNLERGFNRGCGLGDWGE